MRSYNASASWRRYRELLESRFDVRIEREPDEVWRTVRGHQVHLDVWEPAGEPKGTLILAHGAGGHGRIIAPCADFAASLGWRAVAPDLPGYGLTRPARSFRGEYGEWPAVVAELADAAEGPVVLMGLSVGGMTAAFAAEASRGVDGVIATTLLDMGDPSALVAAARWRWLGAASLLGFRLIPWLIDRISLPVWLIAPMAKMSADPAMRAYFIGDPLLGRLRAPLRLFRTMHARKAETIRPGCPLILIHPGADAWTPTALSLATFARVQGPKQWVELTNGSHLPVEEPAFSELQVHMAAFLAAIPAAKDAPAAHPG